MWFQFSKLSFYFMQLGLGVLLSTRGSKIVAVVMRQVPL